MKHNVCTLFAAFGRILAFLGLLNFFFESKALGQFLLHENGARLVATKEWNSVPPLGKMLAKTKDLSSPMQIPEKDTQNAGTPSLLASMKHNVCTLFAVFGGILAFWDL